MDVLSLLQILGVGNCIATNLSCMAWLIDLERMTVDSLWLTYRSFLFDSSRNFIRW